MPSESPPTRPAFAAADEKLKNSVILAFAAPRIAFGIMGALFGVYLMKFATDVLLIASAIMGTIIAVSRLWDGVTDPLIGYFSDRTRSRFGRRRVWMFWAAIPMSVAVIGNWSPPMALNATMLVVWMSCCLLLCGRQQRLLHAGGFSIQANHNDEWYCKNSAGKILQ